MRRRFLRVIERAAVGKIGMTPVARNVWQPIASAMAVAAARLRIIRQASGWVMGWADNIVPLWPRAVRNKRDVPLHNH